MKIVMEFSTDDWSIDYLYEGVRVYENVANFNEFVSFINQNDTMHMDETPGGHYVPVEHHFRPYYKRDQEKFDEWYSLYEKFQDELDEEYFDEY